MFNNKKLSGKILCGAFATSSVAALSTSAAGNTAVSGAAKDVLNEGSLYDFLCKNYGKVALIIGVIILFVWYLHNLSSSRGNSNNVEIMTEINQEKGESENYNNKTNKNGENIMQNDPKFNRLATVEDFNAVYKDLMHALYPFARRKGDPKELEEGKIVGCHFRVDGTEEINFCKGVVDLNVEKAEDSDGAVVPHSIELSENGNEKVIKLSEGKVVNSVGTDSNWDEHKTTLSELLKMKKEILKFLDDYKNKEIPGIEYSDVHQN